MKKIFVNIFVTLGALFVILIIAAVIFYIKDPYQLKPLLFGVNVSRTDSVSTNELSKDGNTENIITKISDSGFVLSEAQKQALVSIGLDPAVVPSTINAVQTECFVSVLGEARVAEIKAGAVPGLLEFAKAKACI